MNLNDTKAILREIALIDNRKLDEAVALAWHSVINHMDYEIAKQALVLARQDSSITYLEPKHIVQWSKEVKARAARNQNMPSEALEGTLEPLCRAHGVKITNCKPCCRRMAHKADEWGMFVPPTRENNFHDAMFANTKKLHAWAKENIYA